MELIKNFGLEPMLLIAQIVNFLIIYYIFKRFLYKPIFEILKKREQTIKEGLQNAKESQEMLEKAEAKERELLKKAQHEARQLIEDAKTQREQMLKDAEESTRKQVEQMLKDAREQITMDTKEAEKRLSAHISKLAIELLQKSSSQLFSGKEQEAVMKHAVQTLKGKAD